jgi:hypothetical protein
MARTALPPTTPTATTPSAPSSDFLNQLIPGFQNLNSKSSDVINHLLNGTPNPGTAQNAAATFGAQNGLGTGSGVTNRYGYDLYNQQGDQRQKEGLGALSGLISSIAQPTLENQGQNQQNQQFYSNLGQQAGEFNASQANENNRAMQQLLAQLSGGQQPQTLGLGAP